MSAPVTKFGLQIRTKKPKAAASSVGSNRFGSLFQGPASPPPATSVLKQQLQQTTERQCRKAEEAKLALLAEDPSVFAYDEVYDDMKQQKDDQTLSKLDATNNRKPVYIEKLKRAAIRRKRQQDVVYQRNILREKKAEDHLYESEKNEAFITSAYKKQMVEDRLWLEQEAREEASNSKHTAAKKTNMMAFYSNLGRNVAAGGTNSSTSKLDLLQKEVNPQPVPAPRIEVDSKTVTVSQESKGDADAASLQVPLRVYANETAAEGKPPREVLATKGADAKDSSPNNLVEQGAKKRNRDADVLSAKERYLKRKRERQMLQSKQ